MTLVQALEFAAKVGVPAIAGAIVSFLAEYWGWYQLQPPKSKRLMFLGVCMIVPLLATLGLILLGTAPNDAETWFQGLAAGFAAFWGSQVEHTKALPTAAESAMYRRAIVDYVTRESGNN